MVRDDAYRLLAKIERAQKRLAIENRRLYAAAAGEYRRVLGMADKHRHDPARYLGYVEQADRLRRITSA